jgi:hypothetical protein
MNAHQRRAAVRARSRADAAWVADVKSRAVGVAFCGGRRIGYVTAISFGSAADFDAEQPSGLGDIRCSFTFTAPTETDRLRTLSRVVTEN